jgi:hypothetical protein
MKDNYITGEIETEAGKVNQVSSVLNFKDYLGALKVRWGFNRDDYKVKPGLYAVGNPDESSDVFVSANYKLSFDHLRKNLSGINAWILVADTRGINVWCAAGKGTFSSKEVVYRINTSSLKKLIDHKRIILPQLSATGVSADYIKALTGMNAVFGPVRASDIPGFISSGYKATKEMRRVRFTFYDRLKLIPVEIVYRKYYLLAAVIALYFLSGLNSRGYSYDITLTHGYRAAINLLAAYLCGVVITPLFLPFIPFRPFALKGFVTGLTAASLLLLFNVLGKYYLEILSWFLLITGVSSFLAINFTGSTTFTSLSGVKKEMKYAIPLEIGFVSLGLILWFVSKFISVSI